MAEVSLDSLNPKQVAKEFKATAKDIKSKDGAVRSAALAKCQLNARYYTEGGCIVPLADALTPKKVTHETCIALSA